MMSAGRLVWENSNVLTSLMSKPPRLWPINMIGRSFGYVEVSLTLILSDLTYGVGTKSFE